MGGEIILPGTGRWQAKGLTEGACSKGHPVWKPPSTVLRTVPLPMPGRIYAAHSLNSVCAIA